MYFSEKTKNDVHLIKTQILYLNLLSTKHKSSLRANDMYNSLIDAYNIANIVLNQSV